MIIVTGGCGFIGYWTVKALLERGYDVRVVDSMARADMQIRAEKLGVEVLRVDVRDYDGLLKAFKDADAVIHLAALVSVEESTLKPMLYHEVNAMGTLNVLRASLKANVGRVVYASSAAVYGEPVSLPVKEDHPTNPLSIYGATKLAGEAYCKAFYNTYRLETIILRYFNVYGPGQTNEYAGVIQRFIERLKAGKPPIIHGDGKQTRDFIHVSDVARSNLKALECKAKHGTFNIASGEETSINRLASILSRIIRVNVKPIYTEPRPGDIRRSVADISKARRVLGFRVRVGLEEGLRQMVE